MPLTFRGGLLLIPMKNLILVLLLTASTCLGQGIASRYPGDIGIQNDPQVLLFDGFEKYTMPSQMLKQNGGVWDGINGTTNYKIDTSIKFRGAKSVQIQFPITSTEWSKSLRKAINNEPVLYARAYLRYDPNFNARGGHRGISMSGDFNVGPCGGTPRDGTGWFVFIAQNWQHSTEPQPGYFDIYAYWPFQSNACGDHWMPTGQGFAWSTNPDAYPDFIPMPNFVAPRGQWFCYELMVKMNDIGQSNGEVKVWKNGALVADFPNLFIRSRSSLLIDSLLFMQHLSKNTNPSNRVWWDNIVVARSYIGPIK